MIIYMNKQGLINNLNSNLFAEIKPIKSKLKLDSLATVNILIICLLLLTINPVYGQYEIGRLRIDSIYGQKLQNKIDKLSQLCANGHNGSCVKIISIAKNHKRIFLGFYAVQTINDQIVLVDIAKNARYLQIREAAIEKMTDENALCDIVNSPNFTDVHIAALKKTTDQDLLKSIVSNYGIYVVENKLRIAALENITDQNFLGDICRHHLNSEVRCAAIKKINKPEIIAALAKEEMNDEIIRLAAVEKVTDQIVLGDITLHVKDWRIRYKAFNKITDQAILSDIAKNAEYEVFLEEAINRVTDQNILVDIAKNAKDGRARVLAVKKITDQGFLVDIVKNTEDENVCEEAVKKITDQNVLVEIVRKNQRVSVRAVAIRRITDQNVLVEIAKKYGENKDIRIAALERITNQRVITDIIKKCSDETFFWLSSAYKITNQDILLNIFATHKESIVKCNALINLNAKENYQRLLSILDQNKKTDPNLSIFAALKIIPSNNTLKKYYTRLEVIIKWDVDEKRYVVFYDNSSLPDFEDWRMIDYFIELNTNDSSKTFVYYAKKGGEKELVSKIKPQHIGVININEICEYLLSPLNTDDLNEIFTTTDICYLREAAKRMLEKQK